MAASGGTGAAPFKRRRFRTLQVGEAFGMYALLGDRQWGAEDKLSCDYIAEELTEIRSISLPAFEGVLAEFPDFEEQIRAMEEEHNRSRLPQFLVDDSALQVRRWDQIMGKLRESMRVCTCVHAYGLYRCGGGVSVSIHTFVRPV